MGLHNRVDEMIRFYAVVSQFSHYKAQALSFGQFHYLYKGVFFHEGGGTRIFCVGQGGTRIFFRMPRGDQKKLATRDHKQTAPPPGKKMIAPLKETVKVKLFTPLLPLEWTTFPVYLQ